MCAFYIVLYSCSKDDDFSQAYESLYFCKLKVNIWQKILLPGLFQHMVMHNYVVPELHAKNYLYSSLSFTLKINIIWYQRLRNSVINSIICVFTLLANLLLYARRLWVPVSSDRINESIYTHSILLKCTKIKW